MRSRAHLESVALNITVPSLALKSSNGVDELPPSPPCTRLLPLRDGELLDPFAFYEDDTDGEEVGTPRKGSSIKKKLQSRLLLNQKICHDTDLFQSPPEHFSPSPVPHVHPSSPLHAHLPRQQTGLLQPPQSVTSFILPGQQQGLLCNPPPPQTVNFLPPGMPANAAPSPVQPSGPSLCRKMPFTAPHLPVTCKDGSSTNQRHVVVMRPAAFSPSASCLARLQHLVKLCTKRQREHGDLFPHLGAWFTHIYKLLHQCVLIHSFMQSFRSYKNNNNNTTLCSIWDRWSGLTTSPTTCALGLDWSEDSADDVDNDEEEAERFFPFQSSWIPQNGWVTKHISPE